MEYQKKANSINGASNQPSKARTKNWIEINDESRGTYRGKLQYYDLAYVIIATHISVLMEPLLLITQLLHVLMQIILIKK